MRRVTFWLLTTLGGLLAPLALHAEGPVTPPHAGSATVHAAEPAISQWCAPELEALADGLCYYLPEAAPPRALVVFLHGVIQPGTEWQWAQQRAMVRNARRLGLAALMPRGRRGIGPKGMKDWWTWPTSVAAQHEVEAELISEWQRARAALEARAGVAFARWYVFGFSNGAYYGSSLALRARIDADGFALFAGGSGASYLSTPARNVRRRAPIYVGYGSKDTTASRDCRQLGAALRRLGWKHRVEVRRGVGHSMTDAQISEAVRFLDRAR